MARISKQQIRAKGVRFAQSGKSISPDAEDLILVLLNTIINDPDPRWNLSSQRRNECAQKLLIELPDILTEIASTEGNSNVVTAPGVLHWLGVRSPKRLQMMGFVFDKK